MLSPTQNGAKLFPRLRARPGPTDRGPGWGGIDGGGGGGEKSRRHRPMVQSSQGWDAAPHSGWGGVKHLHLLRGKGRKPLEQSLLALRPAMASVPLRPCLPHAQPPPCDPGVARLLRWPRAPLLPCPHWLGRDGSWAPGALLRRRLGGRSGCCGVSPAARAGGRRGGGGATPVFGAGGQGARSSKGVTGGAPCFVL